MRIEYHITDLEAARAREFYEQWAANPMVEARRRRNVDGVRPPVTDGEFWEALVGALITTQQRSGPGSAVYRFASTVPYPISLPDCRAYDSCAAFVESTIREFAASAGALPSPESWTPI